jgi:hypothetical protein
MTKEKLEFCSKIRESLPIDVMIILIKSKSKAIPVTGHGGLKTCEMLRIPDYLDIRLTDGGEVVLISVGG